ncbi:MAG: substrate-binding domain-containing protein [Phycisphaerae bacterium]|nr:substrate-binding domain-containing protein [Phycisphaerae bacterium]
MLELEWSYKRHAGIFAGAQQYAQEQGWESTIDEFVTERLPVRRTKSLPYDGVISRASKKLAQRAGRLGLPVVNVWVGSPVRQQLPGVFTDFAAMGQMRAEHLLARGLRRFAAFGTGDYGSRLELAAFQATVREAGFPCIPASVTVNALQSYAAWQKTEHRIDASMQQWQPPIGVFASYEFNGRQVAQMCRHRGWRVPHDVAIVAGQNEESHCEHPRPSLTSVECGYERIGYQAARLLDRLMDEKQKRRRGKRKKEHKAPEHILLPPVGIVARRSTDFHAVDDETLQRVLRYVDENLKNRLTIDELADVVAISRSTLTSLFRENLGCGVAAEIKRLRIERVKRALTGSDQPIQQIAREVGFGSPRTLNDAFRSEVGCTPREYRKQLQAES